MRGEGTAPMIPSSGGRERAARALVLSAVLGATIAVAAMSGGRGAKEPSHLDGNDRAATDAPPAVRYDELPQRAVAGGDFFAELAMLPASGGKPLGPRSSRRAYVGAPPVVPHAAAPRGAAGCRACHDTGMAFPGGAQAPRMSHEPLTVCTQCHVPAVGSISPVKEDG